MCDGPTMDRQLVAQQDKILSQIVSGKRKQMMMSQDVMWHEIVQSQQKNHNQRLTMRWRESANVNHSRPRKLTQPCERILFTPSKDLKMVKKKDF